MSFAAEASAMIWALIWALRPKDLYGQCAVRVFSDNMSVAYVAFRFARASSQHSVCVVRNVVLLMNNVVDVSHAHVHSHCGHPWNELADKLCDAAGHGSVHPGIRSDTIFAEFSFPANPNGNDVDWLFLGGSCAQRKEEYPADLHE
eukprot:1582466-Pyramimonas_sp.AAC.1